MELRKVYVQSVFVTIGLKYVHSQHNIGIFSAIWA